MDAIIFGIELTDPTPISWTLQIGLLLPTLAGIRSEDYMTSAKADGMF